MTDCDIDIDLALEDAYADWHTVALERDAEWVYEERQILAEFDQQEDDAWWRERDRFARGVTYREYLQTQTWKVRAARVKRWGFCMSCRQESATLDAHHLTYERLFDERPSDLAAFCRRCHAEVHGKDA